MISVENLTYKIGNKILLNDISVVFKPGQLHLLLGANGAGKSTLIKAISNQVKPAAGEIYYDNKPLHKTTFQEAAKFRAVLSQGLDLAFPLTVEEVVMMGRYPHFNGHPGKDDLDACDAAMKYFDVHEFADRNYDSLSGGEKQRVQFSRVLSQIWYPIAHQTRYLILDEPLTYLDIFYQFRFMNKIRELVQQPDIVIVGVVHDLNIAAKFADQILLLHEGTVIAQGNIDEVFTDEHIKLAYGLVPIIRREGNDTYLFFS